MAKFLISFLVFMLVNFFSFSQGGTTEVDFNPSENNIVTPTPTAGELGKYGLYDVNMSTGTPSIIVPLLNLNYKELSLPISLSYNSQSNTVDQVATWVGLGWSLNAGGIITRIIRDEPDEESNNYPFPKDITDHSVESYDYLERAQADGFDSEPDLFMFNFLGYTGKFVISRNKQVVLIPLQNIQIEYFTDHSIGGESSFILTTADGVEYTFNEQEFSKNLSCSKNVDVYSTSAWYLTKIRHPSGTVINITYMSSTTKYYSGVNQYLKVNTLTDGSCGGTSQCGSNFPIQSCAGIHQSLSKHIKTIEFGNTILKFETSPRYDVLSGQRLDSISAYTNNNFTKKIQFNYTYSYASSHINEYTTDETRRRLFLTEILEWNSEMKDYKPHIFSYNSLNDLPPRLSFAQDHWGYFNGKSNQMLLPDIEDTRFDEATADREPSPDAIIGLLNRIDYPTKGYTQFNFSNNTFWGSRKEKVYSNYYDELISTDEVTTFSDIKTFVLNYTDRILIAAGAEITPDHYGYEYVKPYGSVVIKIKSTQEIIFSISFNLSESTPSKSHSEYVDLLPGEYEIELQAREFVRTSISFSYQSGERDILTNLLTGGTRISEINNYNYDGQLITKKEYAYSAFGSSQSSAAPPSKPAYISESQSLYTCDVCHDITCEYRILHSSSTGNLNLYGGNNITYRNVTVNYGGSGKGYEEYEYIINPDAQNSSFMGYNIPYAPYDNFGWNNGYEKQVVFYNSSGEKLYEKVNHWVKDEENVIKIPGLSIQQRYSPSCTADFTIYCDEAKINSKIEQFRCINDEIGHKHHLLIGGIPLIGNGETTCIANGNNNQWVLLWRHPCYLASEGETIIYSVAVQHLNALVYNNYSYWQYLNKATETFYAAGQAHIKITDFQYNINHGQMSGKKLTSQSGIIQNEVQNEIYYYPQDFNNSLENVNSLLENHIVKPVKVLKTKESKLLEGTIVNYNNAGLVKETHLYEANNVQNIPAHNPDQMFDFGYDYNKNTAITFDDNNNIIERLDITGSKTSFKWGYENTKLLVYAKNASHNEIYYEGFEEDTTASFEPDIAKAGSYFKEGSFSIMFSPPAGKSYTLEYYSYNNGSWAFVKESYTGSKTITAERLDEVRIYPDDSEIINYSYNLIGQLQSTCDLNGNIVYYKYDSYGRLKNIKDNFGNIIKHYKYNYKN